MLIDWITAYIDADKLPPKVWESLRRMGDRIQRLNMATGEIEWETAAWDSIRSDSHSLVYQVGASCLRLQGSPARVVGTGCNVFGEGPVSSLDLPGSLCRMVLRLSHHLGVALPLDPHFWNLTRADITANLLLPSLEHVREALSILRNCEGGRYRVSQQAGDTVYWSHRSRLRSGKAYAKGPHLEYQNRYNARKAAKDKDYRYREYTQEEIELANRLLRLELRLGSQWWRERTGQDHWTDVTPGQLAEEWEDYFGRMIGDAEMTGDDKTIEQRIMAAAKTEGQGRAALCCWALIQSQGWQRARDLHSRPTWYRHLKVLHAAGLSDLDLSMGQVVPFRRRIIETQMVTSWDELRRLAS